MRDDRVRWSALQSGTLRCSQGTKSLVNNWKGILSFRKFEVMEGIPLHSRLPTQAAGL